jgi:hypothetical protein
LSEWTALLYLGLLAADGSRCNAAEPFPPLAPNAKVVDWVDGDGTLIVTNGEAIADKPNSTVPAKPPAKQGTLADAIINAFGGDADAARRRAEAAQEQQFRALEAQFRPQFQQVLYVELALLRRSCKPDAKPFVEVAKAAKAELRVPLHKYVIAMNSPQNESAAATNEPRLAVQKLLLPLAAAKLGPEKARLYRQQCDKRAEARKHAAVVNLVAALDERLVLTAPQRAKLVESLSAKYEKVWEQYCDNDEVKQCLSSIPEQSVFPLLDEKQKIVWQETLRPTNGDWSVDAVDTSMPDLDDAPEIQEIARLVENVKDDR